MHSCPLLESDDGYPRFLLDGQMAVVDDYLEVRPEAEERLRALAAAGRLGDGSWYILMDEFLVSGETIIRDLQMGSFAGPPSAGPRTSATCPTCSATSPRCPRSSAGRVHPRRRVAGRAVGRDQERLLLGGARRIDRAGRYLPVGYSNGAALPDDAKALVQRVADHLEEIESFLIDDLLVMNGSDHLMPQPWLGRVWPRPTIPGRLRLEITPLPEYLASAPTDGLEHWTGELVPASAPTCSWGLPRTGSTSSVRGRGPPAS